MNEKSGCKELIYNKRAFYEYEVLDTLEVGIVLVGTEIKSLRNSGGSLTESYISCDNDELWLIASTIPPYKHASFFNHEEKRKRKLLAHKSEILKIAKQINEKGLSVIPISLYLKKGIAKLKIGIGRGKKKEDKRKVIQEREEKKQVARAMKTM